jgi:hypothetical protein
MRFRMFVLCAVAVAAPMYLVACGGGAQATAGGGTATAGPGGSASAGGGTATATGGAPTTTVAPSVSAPVSVVPPH